MTIYYDTHACMIVYIITGIKDPLSVTQCHDNNITPKEVHFSINGRYEMNKASTVTQPTMPGMYSYYELSCMIATVYIVSMQVTCTLIIIIVIQIVLLISLQVNSTARLFIVTRA